MEVKISKLPNSQVELEIELSSEEFDKFIARTTLNLGKDLEIEGFRKGKAPKEIVEKKVGQANILVEAADLAVKENYRKAILENKIEAILPPKIDILKLARANPFVFRVKTTVLPEVRLPDYKKIASKVQRKKVLVEAKEIDNALRWIQKTRAKFTLKNGPAQRGDFVEIEYWFTRLKELSSFKELSSLGNTESRKDVFVLGEGHFLPGFEEKLIGMKTGEEKQGISVALPKNHFLKNMAGKKIELKVKVKSVQKVEFPEIGDLFAKSLGKFENLMALKKSIKEGLNLEKEQAETQRVRSEILEKISRGADCQIPEILIQNEQKRLVENLKKDVSEKLKVSFDDYLKKIKKTEKEILESFLPQAQKGTKNFLVLREIGKREGIEVLEGEIKEEVDKILKHYQTVKQTEKGFDLEKLKEYTREVIRNEKIFQLLGKAKRL